jgi:uncharacterized RDD family membrane protein YckC
LQIFLLQDGEKRGPFTIFEVAEEVRSGRASADTQGWHQGSDGWVRLEDLSAASSIFVEPPPRAEEMAEEKLVERRERLAPERMRSSVRLWARLLDMFMLFWLMLMCSLAFGWGTVLDLATKPQWELLLLLSAVLVVLEGFLISACGTTPGKWLMRVRVRSDDGGKISLNTSFYRALTVWWRGVGLWVVPVNLLMMALSQATLLSTGKTPWDHACRLHVSYGGMDRNRVFLILGIFLLMITVMNLAFGEQFVAHWESTRK